MAEDEKKLYTGNLEIGRDRATGRLVSRFIDEDPNLGERTQDEWRDLDSAVQEFFGYSSWKEYKKENMADIKKSMERDEDGQVTQAKTLHPFHVAYAFEEFEENISVEDYTLVGLPKTGELAQRPEAERIRKLVQNRKGYFKKGGFLDQELKNPQEKLINKNIIDRIKKQFNLAEKYKTILGSPMSVMHPATVDAVTSEEYGAPVYWIKNPNNYQDVTTLNRPSDKVLGIDKENSPYSKPGSDGVATSGMLEEQSARNVQKKRVGVTPGTNTDPKAGFEAAAAADAARDDDRRAADDAMAARGQMTYNTKEEQLADLQARQSREVYELVWDMAKIADPLGVLSWKDFFRSIDNISSNPSYENGFDLFLSSLAVIPAVGLIGALGRVAKGTKAVAKGSGSVVKAATKDAQALNSASQRALKQGDEFLRTNKGIASELFGEGIKTVVGRELEKLTQIMRKVGDNLVDDAFDEIRYVNKLETYQSELAAVKKNLDKMKRTVPEGPAREYLKGHTKAIQKQIDEINVKIKNAPEIAKAFKTSRLSAETFDSISNAKNLDDLKSAVKKSELSESVKKRVDDIAQLDDVDLKALQKILGDNPNIRTKKLYISKVVAKWLDDSVIGKTLKGAVGIPGKAGIAALRSLPAAARAAKINRDKGKILGIPDVEIDPSNIELFLLPADWYRSPENFLTEKEKLVARRVKIGIRGYITANTVAYATRNRKVAQVPAASEKSSEAALSQKAQEKVQDIELPAGQHNLTPEQTRKNQLDVYSKEQIADEPNLPVPNIPYSFIESKLGVPAAVWDIYRNELARIESGGDYKKNRKGSQYDGRYQIGADERNAGAGHIGVDPPGNSPEEREQFRNNPELQEMVFAGMTHGNHKLLSKTTLTDKYRQIEDPIERIKILAYAHNQGYKNAAEWLETGASTVDGLGTDGTEFYNAVAAALSSGEKVPTQEMKAIIFGHSQTGRFGETLKSKIEGQGGEVFPRKIGERVNSSKSDLGLAKIIKNISPEDGPFTHAYLFLGGNTFVPGTDDGEVVNQSRYDSYILGGPRDGNPDYDLAKEEIIDYVVDTLKVPRENILVILPPVNRDNAYSASRKVINDKAEQVFKTLGIAVNPQITGVGKNFDRTGDGQGGVHIRVGSGLERRSSYSMLRRFTSDTDEAYKKKARSPYQINRLNKRLAKKHGWSPQDFGADGYDEDLIAKIKRFQKDSSLEVDGIAGLDTAEALGGLYGPQPGVQSDVEDTPPDPAADISPGEDFTPETPQEAPQLSNTQARARLARFKKQYGDYLTDNELREAIATAESQNIEPGQYIRGLLLKDLSDYENSLTRASNNQQFLERFDSTGGVTVLDPRKAYVMPEIIPWLKGLQNVDDGKWLIGDISLPLGGNEQDYARNTVVGGKNRHVRFKHNSHQNGADVDINLPLKGGITNKWNQDVEYPRQLDEEKMISFLKYFKSDSLAKVIFLNKTHVNHLRKYAYTKYGRNSEEYSVVRQSLVAQRGHEDHMHARFNGGPSGGRLKVARARLRGAAPPTIQVAAAAAAAGAGPVPTRKKIPGKPNFSYILGDLEPGGQIYAKRDENRLVASGASMNKPILALAQLLKYRGSPEKQLTKREMNGLLAYTGAESNKINRLASGKPQKYKADKNRYRRRERTIGTISKGDAKTFLNQLGLDPNMKIRHGDFGNNEQTAKQFFDFMRLIHDEGRLRSLGIGDEAKIIVNYMKRNMPGVKIGRDRESKRWGPLVGELNRAGIPVDSLYGKGGLIREGLHYSFVINDKYLLSMYSDQGTRYGESRKRFYNEMITILKDSNILQSNITENKVLNSLFSFADSIENELV